MKTKEQFITISVKGLIQDCSRDYKDKKEYFKKASDIYKSMEGIEIDKDREHFIVFYLNSRRRIIKKEILFIGTENESLCSPKLIFKKALLNTKVAWVVKALNWFL